MDKNIKCIIKEYDELLKIILLKTKNIKSQIELMKEKNILFEKINLIDKKIDEILQKADEKFI